MFVGVVASAAWLGHEADEGPVDVVALMQGTQKNQLAMMASNRGFRVEREEVEAAEELDLVPMSFGDPEGEVRVHVLLASNALYGRMAAAGEQATIESLEVRIPRKEDLALMMIMAEDEDVVRRLRALEGFDEGAFREKLVSIGLGGLVATG